MKYKENTVGWWLSQIPISFIRERALINCKKYYILHRSNVINEKDKSISGALGGAFNWEWAKEFDKIDWYMVTNAAKDNDYSKLPLYSSAHIITENNWNLTKEVLPEIGVEIWGFNEKWIDEFADGIRLCFRENERTFAVAVWNEAKDSYETHTETFPIHSLKVEDEKFYNYPTHWMPKSKRP